jgi:hypothetical protein
VREECADAFGADDIAALNAGVLLGIALRGAGQSERAKEHFDLAYEGLTRRLGDTSSEALACRLGHAVTLMAVERAAEAEAEIREVLSVYQERLGSSHPHTLLCLIDLACALRTLGRVAPALQELQHAIDGTRDVFGEDHHYALAARAVQGVLLADQGELEDAEKVESVVVDRLTGSRGAGHPDTLRCRANLLITRKQLGAKGVERELDEVIGELSALLGPDHPHVSTLRREGRLLHVLHPQPF